MGSKPAAAGRPGQQRAPGGKRTAPAPKRTGDTRAQLLRAAERLFAARGVDAVSMREIAAAAGQANHSAALYHFTKKHDLVNAVLARHSEPIQAAWVVTLDHLVATGSDTLEELVGLMVRSLANKLDDPDGGADYLMIVAQLVASRTFPITSMAVSSSPAVQALMVRMMRHLDAVPPRLLQLRMMRVAAVLYCSIANYQALGEAQSGLRREEFVGDLTSSIVAMMRAPGQTA